MSKIKYSIFGICTRIVHIDVFAYTFNAHEYLISHIHLDIVSKFSARSFKRRRNIVITRSDFNVLLVT